MNATRAIDGLVFRSLIGIIVGLFAATLCGRVAAQGKPNDFLIKKWTTEEGLPQNTVTSIVQTRDGYIWLGTFGGLARFDGIRFTVFDSASMPNLTSSRILSLFEDSYGTLWIGAETGEVYTLRNLKLEEFRSAADLKRKTVWGFEQDAAGSLFIASDSGLEKVLFDVGGIPDESSVQILSRELAYGICRDPSGRIWVKLFKDYFVLENDQPVAAADRGLTLPGGMLQLRFADDGRALAGGYGTLGVADANGFKEKLKLSGLVYKNGYSILAKGSSLWFQQADELVEITDSGVSHYDLKGVVSGGSRAMLLDDEGNLWIASQYDGLVRLTRRKIGLLSDLTDQPIADILALAEDNDGDVWFGGRSLFRLRDGHVDRFSQLERNREFVVVRSIAIAPDGTIWLGGTLGLYRFHNGDFIPEPAFERKNINALFFDRDGFLWVGSSDGLDRLKDNDVVHYSTANGLVNDNVHFITQTSDGTIWVGTFEGISKFRNGSFENLTRESGLSAGYVRDVLEDDDGTMWIATYGGGIARVRNGEIVPIRRTEGLPNNFVSRILTTGEKFWILSNLGIFAVDRRDLNAIADRKLDVLVGSSFGVTDGMPSSEANGGHQFAGIKTKDGRLWFPMIKDVVILDPTNSIQHPPRVAIETASSQRPSDPAHSSTLFDVDEELNLVDDHRNLGIEYTGLSFTNPEDLRFFYRLNGLEDEWIDAGTRRTAFYPYLPPGDYTFEVKALNSTGQWSDNTATLKVTVAQRFWETRWFLAVAFAVFFGVVGLLFLSRHRQQLERQEVQRDFTQRLISAHESERQRMATELHDGLGQNLLLIKNWALLAESEKPSSDEVSTFLARISNTATESIEETRTIVQDLSPQNLSLFGLTDAVTNIVDQIQHASGVVFERRIENVDGILSKESELSVYRIVQEGLNNILKHSGSPRGKLFLIRGPDLISIVIEDHGKGFETDGERSTAGKKGIGLFSIAERVRSIGGVLRIDSAPGKGTKISINIRA